uniref:Uncharacterized protein n=1 Tax=Heterorhabditis bacteriophora TaxID=37862 RepID=A0A1I7W950_HETBA
MDWFFKYSLIRDIVEEKRKTGIDGRYFSIFGILHFFQKICLLNYKYCKEIYVFSYNCQYLKSLCCNIKYSLRMENLRFQCSTGCNLIYLLFFVRTKYYDMRHIQQNNKRRENVNKNMRRMMYSTLYLPKTNNSSLYIQTHKYFEIKTETICHISSFYPVYRLTSWIMCLMCELIIANNYIMF